MFNKSYQQIDVLALVGKQALDVGRRQVPRRGANTSSLEMQGYELCVDGAGVTCLTQIIFRKGRPG